MLRAPVVYMTPSMTSGVASVPWSMSSFACHASPSCATLLSLILSSGLKRCSEYVRPVVIQLPGSRSACPRRCAFTWAGTRGASPAPLAGAPARRSKPASVTASAMGGIFMSSGAQRQREFQAGLQEHDEFREFVVGKLARRVAGAIEVGKFTLAARLHCQPADTQVLECAPHIRVVCPRKAHHE